MNKTLSSLCISILFMLNSLHADWQDWAIGGAAAAAVGGVIYLATQPEAPEKVIHKAEKCYYELHEKYRNVIASDNPQ